MKNIIFLAMSTLPWSTIRIDDYSTPEGDVIRGCQSQLEPVVRYIMTRCKDEEVYILDMATTDTEECRIIGPVKEVVEKNGDRRLQRSVRNIEENKGIEAQLGNNEIAMSALDFFKNRIENSPENSSKGACKFINKIIDLDEPEEAIQKVVKEINELRGKTPDDQLRLWIDTHGGLRDVALLINVVGFLLNQFTHLKLAGIYGTETNKHKIVDQRNAFYSLSFVSGMSDFMNFGNVDVLRKYYQTGISGVDTEIKALVDAMQLVSDGTQFCDPYLYTKGLDALSEVIAKQSSQSTNSKKALLPIFYGTIQEDYGNLLDPANRTSLDIVERCFKKKQYQQALTFIEALMPQYFFDKKMLYFSEEDMEIAKKGVEKSYKTPVNNVFDNFIERVRNLFKKDEDVRNALAVKAGIFAGKTEAKDFNDSIRGALIEKKAPKNLAKNMIVRWKLKTTVSAGKTNNDDKKLKFKDIVNKSIGSLLTSIRKTLEQNIIKSKSPKENASNGETKKEKEKLEIVYLTDPRIDKASLLRVLQMHNILKNSRNKFNHAVESNETLPVSEQRPDLQDIVTVLDKYIKEIRELEKALSQNT